MSSPSPASSPPSNSTTTAPPPSNNTLTPPPTTSTTPPPTPSTTPPPTAATTPPPTAATTPPPTSTPTTPTTPTTPPPTSTPTPPSTTPPTPPSATSPPAPPSTKTPPSPSRPLPSTPSSPSTPSKPSPGSGSGDSGSNGGNNGISTGVVVGIAVAGVAILVICSIICVCCFKKKKRRRDEYGGGGGYYIPPPPPGPPKDGQYGVQPQQHWQQNYPPPAEHYQVPKPPPPPVAGPLRPPPIPPSPPPVQSPFMSSGGGSGSSMGSEVPLPPPSPGLSFGFSKSTFSYDELAIATDNFADTRILGQGGFGYVHKGILPNGKEVAVKSLKANSGQGEREFQAEVEIISRVHHKHLVSLVGYCITGSHRLLVYEFVANQTMEFHLHAKGQTPMDWATRLRIALGAAKGLAYLHEDCHPKIIHRDIKAANILLDYKFEAKVADFGLAKFSSDVNTHVSTRVMGTFGYLAPEYAASGKLSDKSDVFSYGVMLLELITGRRPVDTTNTYMDDSLVDWARPLLTRALEENNFDSLADERIKNNYNPNEMARMVACAAACVRHSARRRPRMGQVVRALEGEVSLSDLNEGIRPGHSNMYSSYGSSDYDSGQYKDDLKKFRQMALATHDYGSSEYGGTTSEYGMYPSGSSSEPSRQTTREMELNKMKGESKGFSGGSAV